MKKKPSYVPSKSTSEKAGAILGEIRRKQAVMRSNKKLGIVVPKSLAASTSEATTTTQRSSSNNNNWARPKKP